MDNITIPGFSPYYGPTAGFSRSFQNFMREIGDCRSKYEEDRIVRKEIKLLKENLEKPSIQAKQMKENLMRMIYFEMLGHDAEFGFIHAVKYTQKDKLIEKRLGYLACCLLLHKDHDMTLLLMNTIQKDLKSSNIMENCIALIAVTRLVNKEMIPALLPLVVKLMQHKRDIIRKKAVMAALWFYHLDPSVISSVESTFEKTLCDRSPAVMGATLNVFLKFVEESPSNFERLTATFVNILTQTMESRLPSDFTYYNVPAPWIQIKLLRILACLGQGNQQTSEIMYEILKQCLESTHTDNNIGCAVLSECLHTSVTIFPNRILTEMAARKVGPLLVSRNNNLKYIGINILAHLIEVDVSYAFRHQMTVIDCLNDPDETLKRKTLVLLYRMANASNVAVICEKMTSYLRSSVDEYLRADLVNRITTLAEKFAPDNEWFIETMNTVLELGGYLVRPQVAHNLMRLIGEGTDDDDLDDELRLYAVNSYLDLIEKQPLPDVLIQLICWVIGEYSYLATHCDSEDVMEKLCSLFKRHVNDELTKPWIVTAVTKIVAQIGYLPDETRNKIEEQLNISNNMEMKQRCAELLCLLDVFQSLDDVLPVDASCEDVEVDPTLSFLDEFVADALARGAAPYKPKQQMQDEDQKTSDKDLKKLNITPYPTYESPKEPLTFPPIRQTVVESQPVGISSSVGGTILPTSSDTPARVNTQKPVKKVWDLSGYIGDKQRSGSLDHFSDSSSTTSGAESSSLSSGRIIKNEEETHLKPASKVPEKDAEKEKLAEQLFAQSPQNVNVRPEKAGFSARRKFDKGSKTTKQNKEQGKLSDQRQTSTLLLDLDDSGVGENSGPEHAEVDKTEEKPEAENEKSVDYQTNEALFEGLVISNETESNLLSDQRNDSGEENSAEKQASSEDLLISDFDGMNLSPAEIEPSNNKPQNGEDLLGTSIENDATLVTENLLDSLNPCIDDVATQKIAERIVPELPEELKVYTSLGIEVISEDMNMKLSIQKVFTPEILTVVLYLINQNTSLLKDVYLSLQPPSNFTSKLDASSETSKYIAQIDGYGLKRQVLTMKFNAPSLHMVIGGYISYKDNSNTQKRLFINCPVVVFDFVRPLTIDTPTYGSNWTNMSYEKKQLINLQNASTIEEICQNIKEKLNFHIVQIIGSEAISAGIIDNNQRCLLHFKCLPSSIELRLKTPSTLLNESIINGITKLFL